MLEVAPANLYLMFDLVLAKNSNMFTVRMRVHPGFDELHQSVSKAPGGLLMHIDDVVEHAYAAIQTFRSYGKVGGNCQHFAKEFLRRLRCKMKDVYTDDEKICRFRLGQLLSVFHIFMVRWHRRSSDHDKVVACANRLSEIQSIITTDLAQSVTEYDWPGTADVQQSLFQDLRKNWQHGMDKLTCELLRYAIHAYLDSEDRDVRVRRRRRHFRGANLQVGKDLSFADFLGNFQTDCVGLIAEWLSDRDFEHEIKEHVHLSTVCSAADEEVQKHATWPIRGLRRK
mmetsp:Transcript_13512/g.30231  ORF Transcript_13512/g.30231 Transcript_13512/m.30231 type:complete len:284 (-) Transcript_13512:56-907(-)